MLVYTNVQLHLQATAEQLFLEIRFDVLKTITISNRNMLIYENHNICINKVTSPFSNLSIVSFKTYTQHKHSTTTTEKKTHATTIIQSYEQKDPLHFVIRDPMFDMNQQMLHFRVI
jgi:hypothetical protein